ncbi:hypothetical protein EQU06_05310 [Lactobacillus sanfranciscensis]|uniref:IS3 family transposase n=1 Tax=Fructilactobacillus sanfranciscensis TaxID=1625 RepID=UPI0009DB5B6B|nr:IS3 family transposase [Fructilactobacillus sanfranciscensis]NDR76252.1 hypothetical protein [Fructilactobacillus sanfranciscensis]NDS04775.1 hypothetical protein [Fructilactobacillus sanfranciscensis]
MAESTFHILKVETVQTNHHESYDELKSATANYVYYYNKQIKTKLVGKTSLQFLGSAHSLLVKRDFF